MKQKLIRVSLSLFIPVACLLVCCDASGSVQGPWAGFAAQLGSRVPEWLKAYRVPGAAVALVQDGDVVWVQGFGYADKEREIPVGAETVFQVGSISKSVTAWAVMRLVEDGKLDLDAPAGRYLSRWHLPPSEYDQRLVTIRRLLSHSAGLSIHGFKGSDPKGPLPSLVETLSGRNGAGQGVRIISEPGLRFRYSGGGYTLLQLIVEEVSGESFAEFMQRSVLNPLGMSNSGFAWSEKMRPLTAAAYGADEKRLPNYLFAEKAAAGLYTTPADLARFVAAALPGPVGEAAGRGVVSAEAVDLMFAPFLPMPLFPIPFPESQAGYGLGFVTETFTEGLHAVEHGGSNRGWRAHFILVRERRAGVVVLTNGDNGSQVINELLNAWGDWLGIGPPAFSRLAASLGRATLGGAATVIVAVVLWFWWKAARRRAWRRCAEESAAQPPFRRGWLRRVALLMFSALPISVWYLAIQPLLEGFIASDLTRWGTLAALLLSAAFAVELIWPERFDRPSRGRV